MPERPLLIFPTPQAADRSSAGTARGSNFVRPSHERQGERISVKLDQLRQAFDSRAIEVQSTATGIDPSQVVVIETIGSVENFAVAVKNIEGAEWLGDFDIDEVVPDDDFYTMNSKGERKESALRGRLYLVYSNQSALQQMLTLWTRYQNDRAMSWPTGLTSMRDIFDTLYDIRRWGIQDRLEESGALEAWREDLEHYPDQPIRTEIELWYRQSVANRQTAETEVTRLVRDAGGSILKRCTIEGIAYQAILAELPRSAITAIVDNASTELVKCDSIMYFRPTGQMVVGKQPIDGEFTEVPDRSTAPYPVGDPCVAVLDGLPVENHELLVDRLLLEDPDDLAPNYQVRDRVHGTSMCSLVIWGDLSEGEPPLPRPVYVRPITKPVDNWYTVPFPEHVPTDELIVDLIHRAVRRLFDGEGSERPSAPTVKIINLSIGDRSRPFFQMLSPLARLVDWLSHKYRVLFVISAGNQTSDIDLGLAESDFRRLSPNDRERLVIHKLYEDTRNRRLLSPAESINGITVNAIHHDGGNGAVPSRLVECYTTPLPSPISAFGSGYRRAIKPDVVFSGGRVLYNYAPNQETSINCLGFRSAPGHLVASPGTSGDIRKSAFCRGTSNAAALTTRTLAFAHDGLLELFADQTTNVDHNTHFAPLLKALLVHSCDWNTSGERLKELLAPLTTTRDLKHWVSRWLGYGEPDLQRMLECTAQRATVLGFGSLRHEQAHVFKLPLPISLGSRTTERRLTVTLAWFSPVLPTNQKYRVAHLWFDDPAGRIESKRQDADHTAVRRGTLQHEVFSGDRAFVVADDDTLQIKVNCREDAGPIGEPIHYGLAVSLEVAEGLNLPIYQEIRDRIRPEIGIRTRNPVT